MNRMMRSRALRVACVGLLSLSLLLCGCQNQSGLGMGLGAAAGAGIGYAVGGGKGALIGGLIGLGLGALIEHLIKESSKRAAETGKPAVVEDDKQRVESYPVGRAEDGDMKVVTVVYDKKVENGVTNYTRAKDSSGQVAPLVETELPSTGKPAMSETVSQGQTQVLQEQDIKVTTHKTVDASGREVTEFTKTSPAGTETFVYADTGATTTR